MNERINVEKVLADGWTLGAGDKIPLDVLRKLAARFTPYGANRVRADVLLALVEAVEAARRIVAIEDLYRDLPEDVRADSLDAFKPKHRQVMNEARAALARFDFGEDA